MKAIVSLSGGLDSTVCAAMAVMQYGSPQVMAVSFDYGQRHKAELEHAAAVAERLSIRHRILTLDPSIFMGAGSALIPSDNVEMPHMTYEEMASAEGVSPTYVPFRNGIFLSLATAQALIHDAEYVYAGMHAEDARNWAYPDCTPEFLGTQGAAIYVGTYHKVRLVAPLMWDMKFDVVRKGIENGAPFELTMSCYEGTEPACGVCPTCTERLMAFQMNHIADPIAYAGAHA